MSSELQSTVESTDELTVKFDSSVDPQASNYNSRANKKAVQEVVEPSWYLEPTSLSQYLAKMNHEIRTPISSVLGFADLVKNTPMSSRERRNYLETLSRNSRHLFKLLEEVFDFARIESGSFEPNLAPVSLVSLLGDLVATYQFEAAKKEIKIVLDPFPEEFPKSIQTDPEKLQEILAGILDSALRTTKQSSIHLRVDENLNLRIEHKGIAPASLACRTLYGKKVAHALGGDLRMFYENSNTVYIISFNRTES